jgi:pilus assembly protein CpaF
MKERVFGENTLNETNNSSFFQRKTVSRYNLSNDKMLQEKIRKQIVQNLNVVNTEDSEILKFFIYQELDRIKDEIGRDLLNYEKEFIYDMIYNEINGYGPITSLLEDPTVTEVMVNGSNDIYVEQHGKIFKRNDLSFINDEHVVRTIERIVHPLGRNIDMANPMVDARLPDGSRVNAIIPPLSLTGPTITIRKFAKEKLKVQDLLDYGSMTEDMATFLEACIQSEFNIIISGGTGSGKTTLLNILSSYIPNDNRIITIEDAAELQLQQEHVISLETRPANIEGSGQVSVRDLVRNCLRMRPDRIVVGEVRGSEALDMLQAMNTGHSGSLTTGHANSPLDVLNRLETMVFMGGSEIPSKVVREQISRAIDVVVQTDRLPDGTRKVTQISEVVGIDEETHIKLKDIFAFEQLGVDEEKRVLGQFIKYKRKPKSLEKLHQFGFDLDWMFK